jgi:hypothetical protein
MTVSMVSLDPTSNVMVLLSIVVMKIWIGVLLGVDVVFNVDVMGKIVLGGTWVVLNTPINQAEIELVALEIVGVDITIGDAFVGRTSVLDDVGIPISIVEFVAEISMLLNDASSAEVAVITADELCAVESSSVGVGLSKTSEMIVKDKS